jgi:ribulose 1,5-bisphosphate synthetase/thiazole synthase
MLPSITVSLLILLLFICPLSIGYDIVIYTATPSGIAAAITAARTSSSLSIAIIEPTAYVGGMASAGGIGLRDCLLYDVREFFFNNF